MAQWILAATLVALQIPDVLTTNAILAAGGRELNPVIRGCMRLGSWWWAPKMLLAVPLAAYMAASGHDEALPCLALLNMLYVAVVASNLRQLRKLRRMRRSPALLLPLHSAPDARDGRQRQPGSLHATLAPETRH